MKLFSMTYSSPYCNHKMSLMQFFFTDFKLKPFVKWNRKHFSIIHKDKIKKIHKGIKMHLGVSYSFWKDIKPEEV